MKKITATVLLLVVAAAIVGRGRQVTGPGAAEGHHQLPDAQRRLVASLHRQGRRLLPEVRPRCGSAVRRPPDRRGDAHQWPGRHGEPLARAGHDRRHARRRAFTLMGSSSNKGLFALVAQKGLTTKTLKGKRFAVGPDRRRPLQLHGGAARHVRLGRSRRAVDSGRHRRERPRGGAADQPRRRHAADGAELFPAGRSRLPGAREPCRSPDGLPVHGLSVRTQGDDREPEAAPNRSSRRTPRRSSASTTTRRSP